MRLYTLSFLLVTLCITWNSYFIMAMQDPIDRKIPITHVCIAGKISFKDEQNELFNTLGEYNLSGLKNSLQENKTKIERYQSILKNHNIQDVETLKNQKKRFERGLLYITSSTLSGSLWIAAQTLRHVNTSVDRKPGRIFGIDDAFAIHAFTAALPTILTLLAGGFAYHKLKKIFSADALRECELIRQELKAEQDSWIMHMHRLEESLQQAQINTKQAQSSMHDLQLQIAVLKTFHEASQNQLKAIMPKVESTLHIAQRMHAENRNSKKPHKELSNSPSRLTFQDELDQIIIEEPEEEKSASPLPRRINRRRSLSVGSFDDTRHQNFGENRFKFKEKKEDKGFFASIHKRIFGK